MGRVRIRGVRRVGGIERATQGVALATPAADHSVMPRMNSVLLSRASSSQVPTVPRKSPNALAVPDGFCQIATSTNRAAIQSKALPHVISSVLRIVASPRADEVKAAANPTDVILYVQQRDGSRSIGQSPVGSVLPFLFCGHGPASF